MGASAPAVSGIQIPVWSYETDLRRLVPSSLAFNVSVGMLAE